MKLSTSERYDVIAEVFRRMTGYMSPGKDESPVAASYTLEERNEVFNFWTQQHIRTVTIAIDVLEQMYPDAE